MREQRHERVERRLPEFVEGGLGPVRRRLVARHLRRCDDCAAAEERQRVVAARLDELGAVADPAPEVEAPQELLDQLLEQAADPGLRGRAAVPVRGAVSGARPGLSALLVLTLLALAAAAVWVGWRLADRFDDGSE